jgi:hypothetical protein
MRLHGRRGTRRSERCLEVAGADMIADICRKLGENAECQIELLDESRKPVFRIRLMS